MAGGASPQPERPATRGADADRSPLGRSSFQVGWAARGTAGEAVRAGRRTAVHLPQPWTNNWQIRHERLREDDYMSLPVLRPRRASCLGRPEVASSVVNVVWEKRGAMLCGFCPRGPKAVLETPVCVRCESSA